MDILWLSLPIAFIASLLSTLSGGGSGLLLIPALLLADTASIVAVAINKVTTVAQGGGAIIRHLKSGTISWPIGLLILLAGLPGVILGGVLIPYAEAELAETSLGVLILLISLLSILLPQPRSDVPMRQLTGKNIPVIAAVIFIIGVINGAFTAGSGLFLTFWLVLALQLNFNQAIAHTVVFCTFCWNIAGAATMLDTVIQHGHILPLLLLGSIAGGYCGAYLSSRIDAAISKKIFIGTSLLMGIALLL